MDHTVGRRRSSRTMPWNLQPGDHCFREDAQQGRLLWVVCPNGNGPARLDGRWNVTEHEDRTVTVSPSILAHASGQHGEWHGFLERGVWREV